MTKFDVVTHIGNGLISRELTTPLSQGVGALHTALPNFGVPLYLC